VCLELAVYLAFYPKRTDTVLNTNRSLENAFDKKGKRKNFLLISTDFSHHGDLELTEKRDTNSWEISNEWDHDVTSYFFVYFGDKKQ